MECTGVVKAEQLTCGSFSGGAILPRYDLLSAALVIISVKMLFGLDDATEW